MPVHAIRALVLSLVLALPVFGSSYVVNDLGDAADASPGNDVCATAGAVCTLRAAIQEANAHAGDDVITFSVAGTISPGSALPPIIGRVAIDGTTVPGYAGAPVVTLQTNGLYNGLQFDSGSSGSHLLGLRIHGCFSAVRISTSNITVRRNYLGPIGGGLVNNLGVELTGTSASCVIGGNDGDGNVISGNSDGLSIDGTGHQISDNLIGTNPAGTAALANLVGLRFLGTATSVRIGGSTPDTPNVISGNTFWGISVRGTGNTVAGNLIGTDLSGTLAIPNGDGIEVSAASMTVIGTPTARNVISGNKNYGVHLTAEEPLSTDTTFVNNYIGVDAAGTAAIPNGQDGIRDESAQSIIGTPAGGNVISGNLRNGIELRNPSLRTIIQNNIIGLDALGVAEFGNAETGISVNTGGHAGTVTIGGTAPGQGNTISGHDQFGISLVNCSSCEVYGNTIGLTADRTAARGNNYGIELFVSTGVTIGAPGGGMNVISGNSGSAISASAVTNLVVTNNRIGTDGTGMIDLGNSSGISASSGSNHEYSSNLISGNDIWGISVSVPETRIFGNTIGRNADNTAALPNDFGGIAVSGSHCTIGSPELGGNIIASNNYIAGVAVSYYVSFVTISANSIFGNNAGSYQSGLGIELASLGGWGPQMNDDQDADTGGNSLQNHPVISTALSTSSASRIAGSLNSTPSTPFALHFYSNTVADPTGFGEGETYLGTTNVVTDAAGNAMFDWGGPALPPGRLVTATATGPSGTSEFSRNQAVVASPSIRFSSASYTTTEDGGSVIITVLREGDLSLPSFVSYATSNDTATAPSDFAAVSGMLTFGAGQSSQTFTIAIVADAVGEPTESFNLTLSVPLSASFQSAADATAVVTITDPAGLAAIPTASSWGLVALLMMLAAVATIRMRV